jgi:hypothetical protein
MSAKNLLHATSTLRTSLTSVKRKISNLRNEVDSLATEVDTFDARIEKVVTESEIYRAKIEREVNREVRRLEKELKSLKKQLPTFALPAESPKEDLKVASTIAIIECLLRAICGSTGEDFRLISYAFIFPAVIERVVKGTEEAYFLEEVPSSSDLVVRRGQEYVTWIREHCDTHLTDPEAWDEYSDQISDWWRNDALPLLYGSRDENWDIDEPLSYVEMMSWKDNPGDRPLQFSSVFDAYEIYRKHKDEVYKSSGVNDYDLKSFTFENNENL